MIYENMTYEYLLNRMINRVITDYPNLDRREGSIVFNALASAALEMAILYSEIDNSRDECWVDTASREYIFKACQDVGIDVSKFRASYGVHLGSFDVEVEIGSRWNCGLYNYTITEYVGKDTYYNYYLTCETEGSAPNNQTGTLTAITDLPTDLTYSELVKCVIEGENETDDDSIREAYYEHVGKSATDGNVAQYKRWCRDYGGIGNHRIFKLWNGDNTVKVSILSASNRAATEALVNEFQEYLDPGVTGMGDGVAPIGAFVTVNTATEVPINVSGTVALKDGYTSTETLDNALSEYFARFAYSTDKTIPLPYMSVGAALYNAEGVSFVSDLQLNSGIGDITLGDEEIPVLGTTNWTVVD